MTDKKSQITAFIIIGIVILFTTATVLYIKEIVVKERPPVEPIEKVPAELQPVKNYVTDCVKAVSKEGLRLVGQHGGYTNPLEYGLKMNPAKPTDSDGIAEFGGVVYWWHKNIPDSDAPYTCFYTSERPPLKKEEGANSIEEQIENYVNENLKSCLGDYSLFKSQGFVISDEGNITTEAFAAEKDFIVSVDYPLNVKKGDVSSVISKFFVRQPVNLRRIYNFSRQIAEQEEKNNFLEYFTMELINIFSMSCSSDRLAPPSCSKAEFPGGEIWPAVVVEENFKSMLASYVQFLQVWEAGNYEKVDTGYNIANTFFENSVLSLTNFSTDVNRALEAEFTYLPTWPIYFFIGKDVVSAESISGGFLIPLPFSKVETPYDVSYPVLVQIDDPSAFNNKGYTFKFALESNIRGNKACKGEYYPGVQMSFTGSIACEEDQKQSGDVIVEVYDKSTGEELEDVQIAYGIGGEQCLIGAT